MVRSGVEAVKIPRSESVQTVRAPVVGVGPNRSSAKGRSVRWATSRLQRASGRPARRRQIAFVSGRSATCRPERSERPAGEDAPDRTHQGSRRGNGGDQAARRAPARILMSFRRGSPTADAIALDGTSPRPAVQLRTRPMCLPGIHSLLRLSPSRPQSRRTLVGYGMVRLLQSHPP
jgi:hypothetical protein